MKTILTYGLLVVLFLFPGVRADNGLALMKVEQGARPAGMGAAFVAVPSDVFSSYYNPASAMDVKDFTATFGHTVYWDNIRLETAYFVQRLFRPKSFLAVFSARWYPLCQSGRTGRTSGAFQRIRAF